MASLIGNLGGGYGSTNVNATPDLTGYYNKSDIDATFLKQTGGTLTGALSGTTARVNGEITSNMIPVVLNNDSRLIDSRNPNIGSVSDTHIAANAEIDQSKIKDLTTALASKLSTVTNANVVANAEIDQSKIRTWRQHWLVR